MKIAFLVSTFPPDIGGMGDVAFEEANRLAINGHQVKVFCLKYKKSDYFKDKNFPFSIVRLKSFKIGDAGFAPQLFFLLKNFDIVHLHYPFYGVAQCLWLAKKIWHLKYFVTYHMDAKTGGIKKILQAVYDFFWAKKVLNNAEKIFIVDNIIFDNSKYLKNISGGKVELLLNGVDDNIFCPWPKEIKIKNLEKNILFVGNLLVLKRLDLLIDAFSQLNINDSRLLIVGGGYEIEKYKKLAREKKVASKISFEGIVRDKRQLANYYNLADVCVVPSDYESFSLSALSSVMCGTPVVVSSATGFSKEVLNYDLGEIFIAGDVGDLAKKIKIVLNNKKQIENNKIKILKNKYSWDKHIKRLEKVYGL